MSSYTYEEFVPLPNTQHFLHSSESAPDPRTKLKTFSTSKEAVPGRLWLLDRVPKCSPKKSLLQNVQKGKLIWNDTTTWFLVSFGCLGKSTAEHVLSGRIHGSVVLLVLVEYSNCCSFCCCCCILIKTFNTTRRVVFRACKTRVFASWLSSSSCVSRCFWHDLWYLWGSITLGFVISCLLCRFCTRKNVCFREWFVAKPQRERIFAVTLHLR